MIHCRGAWAEIAPATPTLRLISSLKLNNFNEWRNQWSAKNMSRHWLRPSRWEWASQTRFGIVIHFHDPVRLLPIINKSGEPVAPWDSAFGVLLSGREDDEIQDYFIRTAFLRPKFWKMSYASWPKATG